MARCLSLTSQTLANTAVSLPFEKCFSLTLIFLLVCAATKIMRQKILFFRISFVFLQLPALEANALEFLKVAILLSLA